MIDITRKLELLAIRKIGDLWPTEIGREFIVQGDGQIFSTAISAICAEALAEIRRLRLDLAHSNAMRFVSQPVWPVSGDTYTIAVDQALSRKTAAQVVIDDPHEPAPEPWGSSFAMNTENWK